MLMGVDVLKNSLQIKRLQYKSTPSKSDFKDRDVLARKVLLDSLQSVMLKTVDNTQMRFLKW